MGKYSRSYNPGAGGVVQHGPVKTKTHHGGGGGDGPPSVVNKPKGPTPEQIAAAKAAAEAKKAIENKKRQEKYIRGFKDKQKKKKGILDKWKDHATASEHMDLTGFGTHEKKGYNFAQNFPTISKTIGPGLAKAYQYGQELSRWGLGPKWGGTDISFVDAWKKGGKESDANIAGMKGKGFNKEEYEQWMKEQGYTAAKGGVARKKYSTGTNGILDIDEESEDISLTDFNPKFDDVPELTEEKEEEKIDLFSETEEGDPLNELLLAEDGVTTLFRAKNGGYAVQGGVKNYLGEQKMVHAPKYWQSAPDHPETELTYITKPEKDLLVKADLHGSLHGSVNKGPQGLTSLNGWGDADDGFGEFSGTTSSGGGENQEHANEFSGIDSGGWDPGVASDVGAVTSDAGWENSVPDSIGPSLHGGPEFKLTPTQKSNEINRILTKKQQWDKDQWKRDAWTLINLPKTPLGIIPFIYNQNKKKNERIAQIEEDLARLEKLGYEPHPWEERGPGYGIKGDLEFELFKLNNPNWNKGPEEKPDNEPQIVPLMEEIEDYTEMAWDPMNYLDKIRAGQAQRASLQAKGIIQDNEIMTLNSGGLANLFRVKNYN